ncbi:MAG: low molecular weight phosphatase family protein, partial [Hyphomonadaceae bacterium]
MEGPPASVLFVCNLNTIRSPMAVGLMQLRFARAVWVDSCGARPGAPLAPDPFMLAVMDEAGVDMSGHRPKSFDALGDLNFDLIITLTPEAHHWALEVTRTLS